MWGEQSSSRRDCSLGSRDNQQKNSTFFSRNDILIKAKESIALTNALTINEVLKKYKVKTTFNKYDGELYSNKEDAVADLIQIFHFEDAADILLNETDYAQIFLKGVWQTTDGQYYFRMNANDNIKSNLPSIGLKIHNSLENGIYWTHGSNIPERKSSVYRFKFLSPDSVEIYCYKDGSRHTFYRQ